MSDSRGSVEMNAADGAQFTTTQDLIREVCDAIRDLLLEKNRAYGDSALNPIGVFAPADPDLLIRTRIDDKLNRIKNGNADALNEDAVEDLIGYLILYKVLGRKCGTYELQPSEEAS